MTGTIFLEENELSIDEPNGTVFVPIVRTGDLSGTATVEYGITDGTATAGTDYVGGTGTITMDPGQSRVVVPVQIINDSLAETTETFAFSIINVDSGSTLLFPRTTTVNILDDENPVFDPPDPPLNSSYIVTPQPVITGLDEPMAFEFAPQNPSLLYIAQKDGHIKVYDLAAGAFRPDFIDLSAQVNDVQDRGLMDIALHPNFPQQPYIYAFYVVDPPDAAGQTGNAGPDGVGNRFAYVVRFTADAATGFTTVVPGSGVILVGGAGQTLQDISGGGAIDSTDNFALPESGYNAQTGTYVDDYIKVDSRSHAGGSLAFGPDGALYISIGDGTSFDAADPRTVSVQDINSLSGKILRVDPMTGLGLPDNPFVQPGDSLAANHSKVFQLGLRNPFSTAFDQDGHLIITNTGWNSWEEIESGPAGANFGWPYFEGGDNGVNLRTPSYQDLPSAAAFYAAVDSGAITVTPAFRAFAHADSAPGFQVQAITGGDVVYSGSVYPAEFLNDFFFTDIVDGEVYVVDVNDRRDVRFLYGTGDGPVHFSQGPDGYVYYAGLLSGTIGRLLIEVPQAGAFVTRGSTTFDAATGAYTLTSGGNQAGTVMSSVRIDVRQDFTIAFDAYFGSNDSGADGLAFVLQNDAAGANAIGRFGGGMAVWGIHNGLAIEFDTYANLPGDITSGVADIDADHTGFLDTDGAFGTTPFALPNIEDGQWHAVVVTWNAATHTLGYTFDGVQVGALNADIISTFLGGSEFAYFGFGGGTGELTNLQRVRLNSADVTYEAQAPDNGPVANADAATTPAGTPVSIDVLANDSDPNGDTLTIIAVSDPPHGTAAINTNNTPADPADDTVTYTPDAGFSGADSFTYTVSDGTTSSIAAVGVTVTPPASPITLSPHGSASYDAASGVFTLTADVGEAGTAMSTVRVDVRQNFTVAFDAYFGADDFGADGLAFVLHNDPAGAGAIGDAGGGMAVRGILKGLAIEFDTYSNDPQLYVSGVPDIASDHTGFVDSDQQAGTTPVALPNIEDGQWHPVVVSWNAATHALSYTLDGAPVGSLNADLISSYLGGSEFAYFGFGGGTGGLFNLQQVRLTGVNATVEGQSPDNGPVVNADTATTQAGTPVSINVLANDSDPNGDALTIVAVSTPAHGTATINTNNTPANPADDTVTYAPAAGYVGSDSFTYTVSDGTTSGIASVGITVTPPPGPITLSPHGSATYDAASDTFTLTSASSQAGTAMSAVRIDVRQDFSIAFDAYLGSNDFGADGVAFVLHNDPAGANAIGRGGSGMAVGNIQNGLAIEFDTYNSLPENIVSGVADIAADHTGFLDTDSFFGTTPVALPNIEDGLWHAVVVNWNAATHTLSYSFDGGQVGTLNNDIVSGFLGGSNFAYFGFGGGTGGSFNVQRVRLTGITATVEGQSPDNGPIANADTATTQAGTPVSINVLANDSDPNGDALTIVAVSDPPHGTAAINTNNTPANPADDTVTYSPDAGFSGADSFTYTVSDGTTSRIASVGVTVTPPPGPITLSPHGSATYDAASDTFTLTSASSQAGTAMSAVRIDVRQDFSVAFNANFGANDFGADGVAFVLHNDPAGANAIGRGGSGMAVGNIQNGLAIEFDTYNSLPENIVSGVADIAADHTGFLDTDSFFGTTPVALPNIEDGLWHAVVVNWNAATHTLSYSFDGGQVGTFNSDIAATFLGGSNFAYLGFGGGTGGSFNLQRVHVVGIDATVET